MSQPFASSKLTDDKHTSDVVEAPGFSDDTTTPVLSKESVDPVYQAKAHVLNNAIQDIGMGKYQWELVSPTKDPLR